MFSLLKHLKAEAIGSLLDVLAEGVTLLDAQGRIRLANRAACELLSLSEEALLARSVWSPEWIIEGIDGHPFPAEQLPASRVLAGEAAVSNCILGMRLPGREGLTWLQVSALAIELDGQRGAAVCFAHNPTPLGFSFQSILDRTQDVVLVTEAKLDDGGPRIVYVNGAFGELTGYTPQEVIGRSPRFLQGPDTAEADRRTIHQALVAGTEVRTTILNYSKSKQPYWIDLQIVPLHDERGRLTHFAAIERDVTRQRMQLLEARDLATTDALTGLLNRRGLSERAAPLLALMQREQRAIGVLVFDVDHFKQVNDRYGHAVGDAVLSALGTGLRERLRQSDLLARLGGEEFVALVPVEGRERLMALGDALRQHLAGHLQVEPLDAPVTVSVGGALLPPGAALDDALLEADRALYAAKRAGRNRMCMLAAADAA